MKFNKCLKLKYLKIWAIRGQWKRRFKTVFEIPRTTFSNYQFFFIIVLLSKEMIFNIISENIVTQIKLANFRYPSFVMKWSYILNITFKTPWVWWRAALTDMKKNVLSCLFFCTSKEFSLQKLLVTFLSNSFLKKL